MGSIILLKSNPNFDLKLDFTQEIYDNKQRNSKTKSDMFIEKRIVGEWLNSSEAARFLGLSPNALRIMVCRGKVKFRKLGSRLRFDLNDLKSLLRKGV